ncbi:MAG: HAD family hydrolase [Ruminiclostridium sp.]
MRAVLFDLDGVIIDSEIVIKAAFTLSFRQEVGTGEPPINEYFMQMGDSFENIMKKMGLPRTMKEPFMKYSRLLVNLIELHTGIKELLEILYARDFKMAVITGKDGERTREILKKLAIEHYFDIVVASDEVKNPKPHPESLNVALNCFGLSPELAIMVGDAPNDIIAARRAGVQSCAVTWGTTSKADLVVEKPTFIVDNPLQIARIACMDGFISEAK